jgi:cytochrome c nitrite reductase small subunit
MRPFLVAHWRGITLFAALGVLAGAGSYTMYDGQGLSYLSNDPRACVNCHVMRDHYESWERASHHAHAACNDCHAPHGGLAKYVCKAENGFWHSKGFTFQDFHEPILIREKNSVILQQNCIRCHGEMVGDIVIHPSHGESTPECVHCHGNVGHGPRR